MQYTKLIRMYDECHVTQLARQHHHEKEGSTGFLGMDLIRFIRI